MRPQFWQRQHEFFSNSFAERQNRWQERFDQWNADRTLKRLRHSACRGKLLDDSAPRQRLGNTGREYVVKNFSRRQKAATYIGVLEKLIQNPE